MASEEHLAILRQGVEAWNQWREEHRKIRPFLKMGNWDNSFYIYPPDLSQADLNHVNLKNADFSETILVGTCLQSACLQGANFTKANLKAAKLRKANLNQAHLVLADLSNIDLIGADISNANLNEANLRFANLSFANLSKTNFVKANLNGAHFRNSNCSGANFSTSHALYADFTGANLTGACIAEWHISSSTKLEEIICDYIYGDIDENSQFSNRRPIDPNKKFAAGEFSQRFQVFIGVLETIDLNFPEGIDWKAFFQSFQELQSQNPDADISIQGMERTAKSFIIRLEVNQEANKAAIETQAKQLYDQQLKQIETHYEERLRLQGSHLNDIQKLLDERQARNRLVETQLSKIVEMMAAKQEEPKYFFQNVQFGGGFAESIEGDQYGGTVNNYGQNNDEINRLLSSLRDLAREFPEDQREAVRIHIEDLATDLKQHGRNQAGKIKARIAGLFGVLLMISGGVATATDFANNILELSKKLNIPTETFQSQVEQLKQSYPGLELNYK